MPAGNEQAPTEAEVIVEEIRTDGAVEAAAVATAAVATETAIVTDQVAAVQDTLLDHAELSEERHTEILEGGEWQRESLQSLLTTTQSLQAQLQASQVMILAELALIRAELTSPASAPLTPIAPAQEITVEPETVVSAEEGPPAVPEIPRRKRPVI